MSSLRREVLVEAQLLDDIIGGAAVTPRHVLRLYETANASWEALAVRVADYSQTKTAVVLIRQPGEVSFVAVNWLSSWPRGSSVKPSGPLDRALQYNTTAHRDVYRYGLGGAEALFCDTARVDGGLAVAVLSPRPSNRTLSALEPAEPIWKERRSSVHGAAVSATSAGATTAHVGDADPASGAVARRQSRIPSVPSAIFTVRSDPRPTSAWTVRLLTLAFNELHEKGCPQRNRSQASGMASSPCQRRTCQGVPRSALT